MTLRPAYTGIAKRLYDDILALPDEAVAPYIAIVVGGVFAEDVASHAEIVQHQVDTIVAKRVAGLRRGLARQAVSKRLGGEDISGIGQAASLIAKAFGAADAGDEQRREWVRSQERDASGRFRRMHRTIETTPQRALKGKQARALNIPAHNGKVVRGKTVPLNDAERSAYQQAFEQVRDLALRAPGLGKDSLITLSYKDSHGALRQQTFLAGDFQERGDKNALKDFPYAHTLVGATLEVPNDISVGGSAFDLAGALGAGPYAAERASAALHQNDNGVFTSLKPTREFADDWTQAAAEPDAPHAAVYTRLGAGARLLDSALGDHAPAKVKLATRAANWASLHGPEAEKVIGPHADRAAYRYRGVERTPDPGLQKTIDALRIRLKNSDAARHALIYGETLQHARHGRVETEAKPSPIINYFANRLGDPALVDLQLKSGVTKPSEGIIVNRAGKVVTQAVGYGDDHYLPFNLKNLGRLKGGEYIRTRTWGGPTTEDIYAGLVSGARSVTVVSHNGVYTVEFDETFRGSRRYNDKAARMVKRYGHLLDAVQSRQVTPPVDPMRMEELREQAFSRYRHDPAAARRRLKELVEAEQANPQLPQAAKDEIATNLLNARAEAIHTADGRALDWTDLGRQYVAGQVTLAQQINARQPAATYDPETGEVRGAVPLDLNEVRATAEEKVATPTRLIDTLGMGDQYAQAVARAQNDYRHAHSPMTLNGEGYAKALKALEEQFPYYLKVSYQPVQRGGRDDPGYVKPKFNRPAEAKAGYFDSTINGWGHRPADQTRYQNYANRMRAKSSAPASTPRESTEGPSERSAAKTEAPRGDSRRKAVADLYDAAYQAVVAEGHTGAGKPLNDGSYRELEAIAPNVYGKTKDELLDEYDAAPNKAAFHQKLVDELRRASRYAEVPGFTEHARRAKDPEGAVRPVAFSYESALKNYKQNFSGLVEEGLDPDAYTDIIADAGERLGLMKPESPVEPSNEQLDKFHATLKRYDAEQADAGSRGQEDIEPLLKDLATIARARTLRDAAIKREQTAQAEPMSRGELLDRLLAEAGADNAVVVNVNADHGNRKILPGSTA